MSSQTRIQSLIEMLVHEPNDVFLNYSMGIENMALNNLKEAENYFLKVCNLNSEYIAVYYQLGKLYEMQNKNNIAINYYNKGLQKAKTQKNNKAINEFNEAIFLIED